MNDDNGAIRAALSSLRTFAWSSDRPVRQRTRFARVVSYLAFVLSIPLGLASFAYLEDNSNLSEPLSFVVGVLTAAPLALVPFRPLLAWRIAWLLALLTPAFVVVRDKTPWPWHPVQLIILIVALFAAGLRSSRGVLAWIWLSAGLLVVLFVNDNNLAGMLVGATVIVLIADQVRRRREAQTRLQEEQERSELEQARRAILEERTRIARELHDVVAHHMSLIAVRAETAPYRLDGVPAPVAEEFTAIAEASREALTEMRRLLGVLRSATPPAVQPQPGLADVRDLVAAVQEAGVDASLEADPDLRVPAGVGLTAYRIVQEALSNASRHASGAPVWITLRIEREALAVYVVNGPGAASGRRPERGLRRPSPPIEHSDNGGDGGSQGLVGMRERAAMLGGSFAAGPTDEGGFAVYATLPIAGDL